MLNGNDPGHLASKSLHSEPSPFTSIGKDEVNPIQPPTIPFPKPTKKPLIRPPLIGQPSSIPSLKAMIQKWVDETPGAGQGVDRQPPHPPFMECYRFSAVDSMRYFWKAGKGQGEEIPIAVKRCLAAAERWDKEHPKPTKGKKSRTDYPLDSQHIDTFTSPMTISGSIVSGNASSTTATISSKSTLFPAPKVTTPSISNVTSTTHPPSTTAASSAFIYIENAESSGMKSGEKDVQGLKIEVSGGSGEKV